jgi:hypothetical protein
MGDYVALPTDGSNLTTAYTYQNYLDVATDDDIRVQQCSTGGFTLHLFKRQNSNNTDFIYITCQVQSSLAPTSSAVYLQVFNNTSGLWETIDSESLVGADIDFNLTGSVITNLSDYYAVGNWVYFRVYQEAA